jgi:hypothetical protein
LNHYLPGDIAVKAAYRVSDDFTSGNFEFGAQATAVAITAGASASAGTTALAQAQRHQQRCDNQGHKYHRKTHQ